MTGLEAAPTVRLTSKEKELSRLKFPGCIGFFPECVDVTEDKPGKECKLCPYFKKKK